MSNQIKHIHHLNDIEKKNNFSVPEGYFKSFSSRLNKRIELEKENFSSFQRTRIFALDKLAFAASFTSLVLLMFSGMIFLLKDNEPAEILNPGIAKITEYQINEIEDKMLFELYIKTLSEDQSQQIQDEKEILNMMIEYLLFTDFDIGLIAEEL